LTDVRAYSTVHGWLVQHRGYARNYLCPCGEPATGWAYQHTGDPELRDEKYGWLYSLDINDYVAMCQSCHRLLDNLQRAQRLDG